MYLHNINIVCIENNSSMGVRGLDCMGGETVAETWQQFIRCASSESIICACWRHPLERIANYLLHHGENNHTHLSKQVCPRKRSITLLQHTSATNCAHT